MNRTEKVEVVAGLERKFQGAAVSLLAHFRGLTVAEIDQLRREIRAVEGEYRVTKNTLARRVLDPEKIPAAREWLEGPTALVFGYGDPIQLTKVVAKWAETAPEKFSIKGGFFEGETLDAQAVVALSKIPSREVLRAQLLGLLQTPATRLVRVLSEPGAALARVLAARRDRLETSEG